MTASRCCRSSTPTSLILLVALSGPAGCSLTPYDYSAYLHLMPRSILVLPPLNESQEVDAPYSFLSTVTRPLAEAGYYVYPVAVIDQLMKQEGLPTPGEMHQVPLRKFEEIFGADAVLYITIKDWGTSYRVIDSSTTVSIQSTLVDVRTGRVLWKGSATQVDSSMASTSSGTLLDPILWLTGALVHQVASALSDPSHSLARSANHELFYNSHQGLLLGSYHPDHEGDQRRRREELARRAK